MAAEKPLLYDVFWAFINLMEKLTFMALILKKNREEALNKISFVPQHPPALRGTVKEIMSLMSELCNFPMIAVEPIAEELGLIFQIASQNLSKTYRGG